MVAGSYKSSALFVAMAALAMSCSPSGPVPQESSIRSVEALPSVLLVTLDTTRADRMGFESDEVETPELEALAARGVRFTQAYSTVPTTLPSHTSMLTGLYPADHGIRENGRRVSQELELLAELLKQKHYSTAAFVSGFPLSSEFGLARGFDHYDDEFGEGRAERPAAETTDQALAFLLQDQGKPAFVWVHYFDAHEPYEPPEPFGSRYVGDPYLGEIAYMDQELGRLIAGFEDRVQGGPWRIIVAGDHGEGLGDHGETLHGNLLYQGVMRVPLILAGSDIAPGEVEKAVSVRQIFDTVLGWAGAEGQAGLLTENSEPVLAEAMKPYLQYGWQPQFMAVKDGVKIIRSAETEVYDLRVDPEETENLAGGLDLDPQLREALSSYAAQALAERGAGDEELSPESREKLASLGYFGSTERPPLRQGAPNPKDMVHLYRDLDIGASLFITREYEQAITVFSRISEADPTNFAVALRLAVAHSVVGNGQKAMDYFERAGKIDPSSVDLRHYQAMHFLRSGQWDLAEPLFESVLVQTQDRLPALEGLAQVYTRQGRVEDAARLLEKIVQIKDSPGLELARLGELRMARGDTAGAIRAFEKSRDILGEQYTYNLELGVLYLANRQLSDAATSLDKVSTAHPGYPMALFKRAQVSVLLAEPDRTERVKLAWQNADDATRSLIENEQLFRDIDE
jgi:choline-sulfatase